MLDSIPIELFHEWIAYNCIDPIGEDRKDWRSALVACTIANSMRTKRGRRLRISQFMPKFGPRPRQTWQQQKAIFKAFASVHNRQFERDK